MATTDTRLRAVHEAIDEFEAAVKRHEHKKLWRARWFSGKRLTRHGSTWST